MSWRIARRNALEWRVWFIVSVLFSVGRILGGKILYDIQHPQFDWQALFSAKHHVRGGYWGGLLAYLGLVVPAALLLTKRKRAALDLVALSIPVPFLLAKLGCLLNGCCYGRPSALPWAIVFPEASHGAPAGIPLHPTQIYEMVVMIVVLLVFSRCDRDRWRGSMLLWFVAIYGLGRALCEAFRGDFGRHIYFGPLTLSQLVCLGAVFASVGLLLGWRHWPPTPPKEATHEQNRSGANA